MSNQPESRLRRSTFGPERIGELMSRRQLAGAQLRIQLARRLQLSEMEAAALEHLLAHGGLTASQLADRLNLTSGGVTGLTHRMERAGHITRERHPIDRRSIILRSTPAAQRALLDRLEPCMTELQELVAELTQQERDVVGAFFERSLEITEQHAEALAAENGKEQRTKQRHNPLLWG